MNAEEEEEGIFAVVWNDEAVLDRWLGMCEEGRKGEVIYLLRPAREVERKIVAMSCHTAAIKIQPRNCQAGICIVSVPSYLFLSSSVAHPQIGN